MNKDIFALSACDLKNAYKVLGVSEDIDDVSLVRKYKKLHDMYWYGTKFTPKSDTKADEVFDAYYKILASKIKEKYQSCYKNLDKTIEFSLPDAKFFKDPIKGQFMITKATDYTKICGGGESIYISKPYDGCEGYIKTMFEDKMVERKSMYSLKTNNWHEFSFVDEDEISKHNAHAMKRHFGIRPIIDLSKSDFSFDTTKEYYEIEYGEYPQKLAPINVALELELAYRSNDLISTGKTYTKDSNNFEYNEYGNEINPTELIEYYFEGKKYVRVEHNILNDLDQFRLSNGKMTDSQDIYWIEVSPLECIAFPKDKVLLSKYTIMSGIPYNLYDQPKEKGFFANLIDAFKDYSVSQSMEKILTDQCYLLSQYDKNLIFEMTDMYMFLNKYMRNDVISVGALTLGLDDQKIKKIGGMH